MAGTTYISSNTKVATVDSNAKVTAMSKGNATITALCGGKKYTMNVKVFDPEIAAKSDAILADKKASVLTVKNGNGKTEWSTSDANVVTVDKNGKITGLKKDTALITAVNNGRTMTKTITVE